MKVLFVDNETDIVTLVELALDGEDDIDLTAVTSGEAAMGEIATGGYDVFVFDLMMPPPDGRQLLRAVRSDPANAGKPVLMCTAKSDAVANDDLRDAGATDVLPKPFDPLSLADVLREIHANG
jgi:DNA-binding response OmpR family regulator